MRLWGLLVLTVALYARVGSYGFVYEDEASMNTTRAFEELTPDRILTSRVLSAASLYLKNPIYQHLFNVLIHLTNGLLVYELATRIGYPVGTSLFASGLFLLHPIQVEAVAYVSGRADLLMTYFVLMASRWMLMRRWVPAAIAGVLALLSKEAAVVALGLIPLVWVASGRRVSKRILWVVGTALAGILAAKVSYVLSDVAMWNGTPWLAFLSFWRMVGLAIVPVGFSVEHVYPDWRWLGVIALFGVVVLAGITRMTKRQMVSFGLTWVLISVLPRFLVRQQEPISEHQTYLAFVGLWFVLADVMVGRKYVFADHH